MVRTITPHQWESFARHNRLERLAAKVRPHMLRVLHEVSYHGSHPHLYGLHLQVPLTGERGPDRGLHCCTPGATAHGRAGWSTRRSSTRRRASCGPTGSSSR